MKHLCIILPLLFVLFLPAQNRKKIDSLIKAIHTGVDDTNKVIAYYKLSRLYWNSSPDTTIFYARKSLGLAQKLNDGMGIAGALNSIGVGYSDMTQFDSAVHYYLMAEKAYDAIKNAAGAGMALNNIGVVYKKQGKYEKATEYYLKALKIAENTGDKKSESMTLNNIAIIFRNKSSVTSSNQDLITAKDYAFRSIRVASKINNSSLIASAYTTLGTVSEQLKQYDSTLFYYRRALDIYKELNDKRSVSILTLNLGIAAYFMRDFNTAERYYTEALRMKEDVGDKNGLLICYNNLGSLEAERNNYKKAYEYYLKAEKIAKEMGSNAMLMDTYKAIYQTYEKQGNFRDAFHYHKLFSDMKDSLVNAENLRSIAQMQTRYESEKKDQEIFRKDASLKQKELESSKNKTQRNAFIIASVLMLVLAGAIFMGYKQKKKANLLLHQQKNEISRQKTIVEEQKREIIDSIHYARRIQESLLPKESYIEKRLRRLMKK